MNVKQELVDVVDDKRGAGPALLDDQVEGGAIVKHGVGAGRVLKHLVGGLGRRSVQWCNLQGRLVEQDKVAATGLVGGVKGLEDAFDKVGDALAWFLMVVEEAVKAQVIGADPDGVRSVARLAVGVQLGEGKICLVGGDLVLLDRGEVLVGAEVVLGDLVGAHGASNRIVIVRSSGGLGNEATPSLTTAVGLVAGRQQSSGRRRLIVVAQEVGEAVLVSVAIAKGDEVFQLAQAACSSCSVDSHGTQGRVEDSNREAHVVSRKIPIEQQDDSESAGRRERAAAAS